jgi:catechol 2,3-dioxygenase-like lactoylglutathione lyase family enzyme
LRAIGSGNIGATNVLRTGRKGVAAATLLLDLFKGAAAVWLVRAMLPGAEVMAAGGAVLGHCFPVWLRFRGGKGVATLMGVSLGLAWQIGLAYAVVWIGLLALLRLACAFGCRAGMAAAIARARFGPRWRNAARIMPPNWAASSPRQYRPPAGRDRTARGRLAQEGRGRRSGRSGLMVWPDERPRAPLSSAEAFARLRLLRSPRVGAVTYYHLLASHGSAAAALDALPALAAQGGAGRGGAAYRPADPARIRAEMDALDAMGGRYLFHDDPHYPALLAQMEGAPPILSLLGEGALLDQPGVAIVGARNASAAAMRLAREFPPPLSRRAMPWFRAWRAGSMQRPIAAPCCRARRHREAGPSG